MVFSFLFSCSLAVFESLVFFFFFFFFSSRRRHTRCSRDWSSDVCSSDLSGSCVVPGDFNGDGRLDLFVGRRAVTRRYGLSPRSYLLQNDGKGQFRDVTLEQAPALAEAGMVTSAAWIDYDNDGQLDLVVVGEWMPVRVFRQEHGRLVDRTAEAGLSGTEGWWNTVAAVDLNGDGRKDLVLGNLGLNSYLRASP